MCLLCFQTCSRAIIKIRTSAFPRKQYNLIPWNVQEACNGINTCSLTSRARVTHLDICMKLQSRERTGNKTTQALSDCLISVTSTGYRDIGITYSSTVPRNYIMLYCSTWLIIGRGLADLRPVAAGNLWRIVLPANAIMLTYVREMLLILC